MSVQFQFSTDDLPERERFDAWAHDAGTRVGAQRLPLADASGPFRASLAFRSLRPMVNIRINADAHRTVRSTRDVARRPMDAYWIYREEGAGAWFNHGGREFLTRPGSLVIADANVPFDGRATGCVSYESWLLPKTLLDPHLPALGRPLSMSLQVGSGLNALAATYLDSLTRNWDHFSEAEMMPVADTLGRLIGIACGTAAAEQPNAVRAGRLVEAKRYIGRHLADPDLSSSTAAAALGISVRTLHLLFEPSGSSFARHVQRRRLEECRSALLANPTRPVIDIAFAWGYSSLSSFYRAFQMNFGISPGGLREASRDQLRS